MQLILVKGEGRVYVSEMAFTAAKTYTAQKKFSRTAYECSAGGAQHGLAKARLGLSARKGQPARVWRGTVLPAFAPARVGSSGCGEISACQCWLCIACKVRSMTLYRKLDIICVLWNIHEVQGTDFRCCTLAHLFHVLCTH